MASAPLVLVQEAARLAGRVRLSVGNCRGQYPARRHPPLNDQACPGAEAGLI